MPRPPVERAADNPWPEWPKVYKLDYGQEEAAAKYGDDPRVYLTTVKKFVGNAQGGLESLVTVEVKWERNAKGAMVPVEVPGTEQVRPAQLALLAMGFLGPSSRCSTSSASSATRAATCRRSTAATRPT